jgi:hypothetical protein
MSVYYQSHHKMTRNASLNRPYIFLNSFIEMQ